jgi:hypothetical protein
MAVHKRHDVPAGDPHFARSEAGIPRRARPSKHLARGSLGRTHVGTSVVSSHEMQRWRCPGDVVSSTAVMGALQRSPHPPNEPFLACVRERGDYSQNRAPKSGHASPDPVPFVQCCHPLQMGVTCGCCGWRGWSDWRRLAAQKLRWVSSLGRGPSGRDQLNDPQLRSSRRSTTPAG